jgi:hypothetical protein
MERVLDKRKEEALVVVTLSTATLIVCFSIIGRVPWPRWGEGHICDPPGCMDRGVSRARTLGSLSAPRSAALDLASRPIDRRSELA